MRWHDEERFCMIAIPNLPVCIVFNSTASCRSFVSDDECVSRFAEYAFALLELTWREVIQ